MQRCRQFLGPELEGSGARRETWSEVLSTCGRNATLKPLQTSRAGTLKGFRTITLLCTKPLPFWGQTSQRATSLSNQQNNWPELLCIRYSKTTSGRDRGHLHLVGLTSAPKRLLPCTPAHRMSPGYPTQSNRVWPVCLFLVRAQPAEARR